MATILTGDRPTGPLHLGHYIGSLQNRIHLQQQHQQFVMIADLQAMTDNLGNPKKIQQNIIEVMLDYLAVGIEPDKTIIFLQSLIPELAELAFHYMNLVTLARLERNPTVKNEIQLRGFKRDIPVGFYCYPISQAADITAFKATLIPVGIDQKPMIELTNDIVRSFNRIYQTDVLTETECLLSDTPRLSGIYGQHKMSKSLNNAIFIKDSPEIITQKVQKIYTDPNHLLISDPGQIIGNVVFEYLDAFDPDQNDLAELKAHYQHGGIADKTIKARLCDILIAHFEPIYKRRCQYQHHQSELYDILISSSQTARETAANTLSQVRRCLYPLHAEIEAFRVSRK